MLADEGGAERNETEGAVDGVADAAEVGSSSAGVRPPPRARILQYGHSFMNSSIIGHVIVACKPGQARRQRGGAGENTPTHHPDPVRLEEHGRGPAVVAVRVHEHVVDLVLDRHALEDSRGLGGADAVQIGRAHV